MGDGVERDDRRRPKHRRVFSRLRYSLETFIVRLRGGVWTLVQLAGFAAFLFGAFRLFGILVYNMDGIGPFSREFFTTFYAPGPWSTLWEVSFLWMGLGIAIVLLSTRQRPR